MASTTIQRFAAKAGLIASRYTPGEERNIVGTYANNLKERLEELDEQIPQSTPIYPCGDSSSLLCKHSFCRCQQWTSSRPRGSRCPSCSHWVTHHVLHGIQ